MKELLIIFLHFWIFHQMTLDAFPQGDDYPNSYYNRLLYNDYESRSSDDLNTKFVGAGNEEDGKTFHRFHRRKFHRFQHFRPNNHHQSDPCRSRSEREYEGRFFWDLIVNNYYPNNNQHNNDQPSSNCGGSSDGGVQNDQYRPPNRPLFSIPISRPIPTRKPPPLSSSAASSSSSNTQNDNAQNTYDPVNDDRPVNENIPYDNPPPMQLYLTPGQAVGGIASTVNSVIQTLTGNNRPGRRGGSVGPVSQFQADPTTLNPGQIVGGLANTVNSVIQTLSGNGPQGGFLDSLYSGFNFF